jgi:hypothetical protein
MDYRPSKDRFWIWEWYKEHVILSFNQNPGLHNKPIPLVGFGGDQLIKCSDSAFFKYSGSVLWGSVVHILLNNESLVPVLKKPF